MVLQSRRNVLVRVRSDIVYKLDASFDDATKILAFSRGPLISKMKANLFEGCVSTAGKIRGKSARPASVSIPSH